MDEDVMRGVGADGGSELNDVDDGRRKDEKL